MPGQLQHDGDGPLASCYVCGRAAAGPCARCHGLVCADCCVLTDGGATAFAICVRCERRGGASLRPAWRGVLGGRARIRLVRGGGAELLVLAGR